MSLKLLRQVLPIVLVAAAVAGCESQSASVTEDDPGYKALLAGDYATAQKEFEPKQAKDPHDPYFELDLAAAYQQLGRLDLAEALDRQAMVDGKDVYPPHTTFARDNGKSIAFIACENIGIARHTEGCAPVAVNNPPPPPAPKNFVVFFDFNKSKLTPDSERVVAEAVKTAKETGATSIQVTGYTDTVGSDSYNLGLSVRRASAVKSAMLGNGMANVSVDGRGFHDLLVPTGPGVREPQNRRAVIMIGGNP